MLSSRCALFIVKQFCEKSNGWLCPIIHALRSQNEPIQTRQFEDWLPPRDSNPDMLIQSQLSYH